MTICRGTNEAAQPTLRSWPPPLRLSVQTEARCCWSGLAAVERKRLGVIASDAGSLPGRTAPSRPASGARARRAAAGCDAGWRPRSTRAECYWLAACSSLLFGQVVDRGNSFDGVPSASGNDWPWKAHSGRTPLGVRYCLILPSQFRVLRWHGCGVSIPPPDSAPRCKALFVVVLRLPYARLLP
jgi:hypothetical protein